MQLIITIIYIIFIIRNYVLPLSPKENIIKNKDTTTQEAPRTTTQEIHKRFFFAKIIFTEISQSSNIFSGPGQGLQCVPNSILSLLYHHHKQFTLWEKEDLHNILYSGNILYNSIGKHTTLLVSDIPQYIKLYNFIYQIKEHNSVIGYIFQEDINFNAIPFIKVQQTIITHKYCILLIGHFAVSIIHSNNNFHIFDPHTRNQQGLPTSNEGGAVGLTFNNFNKLCMYINQLSQSLNSTIYELIPIIIVKYKHMELNENILENVNAQQIKEKTKITPEKNSTLPRNTNTIQLSKNNCTTSQISHENSINLSNSETESTFAPQTNKRKLEINISQIQEKKIKLQYETKKTKKIHQTTKHKYEDKIIETNNKKRKIEDPQDIFTPKHPIKDLEIKLPNILTFLHNQKNEIALKKAKENNLECKKYGYNFKIPLVYIKNITYKHSNAAKKPINLSKHLRNKYGTNLNQSIEIFNTLTSDGPIYICSICQQTNFIDKVTEIAKLHKNKNMTLINECRTHYKSINNKEYICNTCKEYIYKGKIPKLSIKNGCGFPEKPNELNLFNLEERFISPVMAFMLIHQLFPGGQFSLYGSICHLPIEIGKIISTLPRTPEQCETIAVKLKRRLCYKNSVFHENIRLHKIITALEYLLQNSELYKKHNINIDPNWLQEFSKEQHNTTEKEITTTANYNTVNTSDDDDVDNNKEDEPNAPSINTLVTENSFDSDKNILCIAPAEGQKPIFTDEDTEYLCFPTIFCGQKRNSNNYHKLTKREIFKYEMRSIDKRVSTNIPNIFWKTKFKQINQIHQQVSFALRRKQTKGKTITAQILLNKEQKETIVKYDDGYHIFKNIRSSPPYFEHKKKELMAMIRQLGIPTLFISLSAADTKWIELLKSIYILVHHKTITNNELENMSWSDKCELISKDPGTCARFFNNKVQKFIKHILKSPHSPFGILTNSFYRVEFQHRGSPHIHGLLWIKNAPHYQKNSDNEIIQYIDSIISCCLKQSEKKYVDLQIHKHSKTCIKKIDNKKKCRFGAPWPPLDKTQILYPLEDDNILNKQKYSKIYSDINKFIHIKYKDKNFIEFPQILNELNISYKTYILALRSTINKRKIFLKRNISDIFVNNYMTQLIHVWQANHDIQYVLDPYSCVVYICDYLMKNNKGMSKLLENAAKEAKKGNMDLKKSVRHIGNKFLNCNEMSEQECAYSLLELPITQSSIKVEFINTSEIQNRVFITKPDNILKTMDPNSEDIKQKNNIDNYSSRPSILANMCLADFVALTETSYKYKTELLSDDNMSVNDISSDDENNTPCTLNTNTTNFKKIFPIKLTHNKIIKLRKHPKVIRFVNYKYKIDPENYCREKLLLYVPWQYNELNILEKYTTYIDAYNHFQKTIHEKMKIYEPAAEIIEHALLEYEEHPDKFIPTSHATIEDNTNDIPPNFNLTQDKYSFLIPTENITDTYDLKEDLKIPEHNYIDSIQTKPNILDTTEFLQLINSFNTKQYTFFLYIMQQQMHNENSQTMVCLHGGAGTGKSYVLKGIYQGLTKLLNCKPGQQTDDLTTLLIAPTGKAAHNIKGHTIHSAFHVPANQPLHNYKKLTWDNLNTYRSKYLNLKWIICDEISMVSNYMLRYIHLRLQEIKGNKLLFGGINIIAVGDLYQLKPVMGQFIFEDYTKNYEPLATNLWTEHFKLYNLTEIMRQKDDKKFAQLLNRLRTGNHTKNDIETLKNTKIINAHLKNKKSIPHFFPTLEQVNAYNYTIKNTGSNFTIESICTDILPSSISKILETNINSAISKRKTNHTGGLPPNITLITNEQYDLISNIDVTDGLINGTQCIIKYIQTTNSNNNIFPYIVWVDFQNPDIGSNHRQKYSYLYSTQTKNTQWTPIIKIKRTFIVKDHWIHRIQFPLRQAAARTIHVSQSSTYPQIYVDLNTPTKPPTSFWEHMHYVAFSRVTSISGLYIENINETTISTSKKVSNYLNNYEAHDYFETHVEFHNTDACNILLNNARSFKKYFNTIKNNQIVLKQNINIFLESKLSKHDKSIDYQINNSIIIRTDDKNTLNPHHGIISYIHNSITINKIQNMSTDTIDTLYMNITHKNTNFSIFAIYNSPRNTYTNFINHLLPKIQNEYLINKNIIIIGDFNIQHNSNDYLKLCSNLAKYKLQQHVNKYTTINNTTIDFVFTNMQIQQISILYAHWSDHNIIQLQICT